jgi:hypothetical protein
VGDLRPDQTPFASRRKHSMRWHEARRQSRSTVNAFRADGQELHGEPSSSCERGLMNTQCLSVLPFTDQAIGPFRDSMMGRLPPTMCRASNVTPFRCGADTASTEPT